ncbi:hypothetical protein ACHAXT_000237 [Thalassiosira profunda]
MMLVARRDSLSMMNLPTDQGNASFDAMVPDSTVRPQHQQLSQSLALPAKGSLIDNTLALALRRARTGEHLSSLTMTKSLSDSSVNSAARPAAKFTYKNHHIRKIASAGNSNSHSPQSSIVDVSQEVAAQVTADMCPYTYVETVLAGESSLSADEVMAPLHESAFEPITDDDIAAYSHDAIAAVRANDVAALRALHAQGRPLRQCNRFGESLLHVACRRSSAEVVSFLLTEARVSPRIKDDYGRTPLHDACWRGHPAHDIVEMLLTVEPKLAFVPDVRGHRPFQYARREHWAGWRAFLERRKDLILSS